MKKINLFLLFLLVSCAQVFGKSVPVSVAKTVGYNYLIQKGDRLKGPDDLKLEYTSGSGTSLFYVFNSDHSFVLVAADDGVIPVLAYSKDRVFHSDHIPSNVAGFLESYNKQINYVAERQISATPEIAANWNNLVNNIPVTAAAKTTSVSPLLSTTWDQYPNYNAMCPADAAAGAFGGHVVTGCVATATAQVMKYWNWPSTGVGLHSYSTASYGTLSANFGATTYNWAGMPNSVTGPNAAVATLMYHIGVAVEMQYSASESGSYVISATSPITNCAEYALKTYFNYDPSLHGEPRASYSDATWISMLKAELDASRPIIYDGAGSSGGHCFVFDGYDASNNFHVNWGWSGSGPDGYYAIDALNPPALGAGGGGGGFNSSQEAIFGVKPSGGGGPVVSDSLQLYDYATPSPTSIPYLGTFTFTTNVYNYSVANNFSGDYGLLAFDNTGTFVGVVDSLIGATLPAGDVYSSPGIVFSTAGLVSMVPGNYTLGIFYRHSGGAWIVVPNATPYTNMVPFTVYNHNSIELYSPMTATPNPLVQGASASVSLNIYNNSSTPYTDSVYLGLYNLDGTWNSDIQALPAISAGAYAASSTLVFSTSSITATPGTYLLVLWYRTGGSWYLAGADYNTNPAYINVVAPSMPPDMYERNNTSDSAYVLPLTWVANMSSTSTPGSTFHITTDQDYYRINLASGYNYTIPAVIKDIDDAATYTVDAVWSYSTDGGTTWSPIYNNAMTGSIALTGYTGGSVIFHVSPHYAGNTGSYLLQINNITRVPPSEVQQINLATASIYPNPANDWVTVDLSGTNAKAISVEISDMQGKKLISADVPGQSLITIPVNNLSAGVYFLQMLTDEGTIAKKITIGR